MNTIRIAFGTPTVLTPMTMAASSKIQPRQAVVARSGPDPATPA